MEAYHDQEWGVPVHEDRKLFEALVLDGFQAGLSWRTILNKREAFREAFYDFDPHRVAKMTDRDVKCLMGNAAIVRNRLKIESAIHNASVFLTLQREFGSFDAYIWSFTGHEALLGPPRESWEELPTTSPESDAMAKALKDRGFKFVGSTICYAFMQAVGMVDDHLVGCFRFKPR
jgi:DNA-3-methyladenine glycosylase I